MTEQQIEQLLTMIADLDRRLEAFEKPLKDAQEQVDAFIRWRKENERPLIGVFTVRDGW